MTEEQRREFLLWRDSEEARAEAEEFIAEIEKLYRTEQYGDAGEE